MTELKAALEGTSYDVSEEQTKQVLDFMQKSGRRLVSYEEFLVGEIHMHAQEVKRWASIPAPVDLFA